ncbi:Lrp/AsnC family transcriptional regulator [Sediminicola luteus]|uniref:AsnC family transcriptional regulator n=1 Tax=Sediminicola luteus TaxID=319238 RepID=A0A2A4G510_9FLAO|nr:Lrp/AsnC family transcriptional regulator [Sediminicola luteus]PCE64049.1 AsnC family transcriptional regulator [Sediminicola luteus]
MIKLDETDVRLLALLQEDCKKTTKAYALALGLSATAVYERIKRLERSGTITHYAALLDKEMVGKSFVAFCHVKLVQHAKDYVRLFERKVLELEEVAECYHISGDYDYILKILVADMPQYRDFMVTKLTAIDHIGSTHSSFVISAVKHTTAIPVVPNK